VRNAFQSVSPADKFSSPTQDDRRMQLQPQENRRQQPDDRRWPANRHQTISQVTRNGNATVNSYGNRSNPTTFLGNRTGSYLNEQQNRGYGGRPGAYRPNSERDDSNRDNRNNERRPDPTYSDPSNRRVIVNRREDDRSSRNNTNGVRTVRNNDNRR